jgi:hypothetical protein
MGRAAMAPETMATRCSPSLESYSDSRRRSCCISARMASLSWTVRVRQGAQGKALGGSTCSSSGFSSPHETRTSWSSKSTAHVLGPLVSCGGARLDFFVPGAREEG